MFAIYGDLSLPWKPGIHYPEPWQQASNAAIPSRREGSREVKLLAHDHTSRDRLIPRLPQIHSVALSPPQHLSVSHSSWELRLRRQLVLDLNSSFATYPLLLSWVRDLISLALIFLFCKIRIIIIPTIRSWWPLNKIIYVKSVFFSAWHRVSLQLRYHGKHTVHIRI